MTGKYRIKAKNIDYTKPAQDIKDDVLNFLDEIENDVNKIKDMADDIKSLSDLYKCEAVYDLIAELDRNLY